ncbi:hypothetical protein JCM16358_07940 [Halanaerocella petrolearia]
MELFINHKIIKDGDEYVVKLYLNQQATEFANEFGEISDKERSSLKKGARKYIKNKLPDLKVKTVNVMLGSLLVASLPFVNVDTAVGAENSQVETQSQDIYIVQSGDTLYQIADEFGITVSELKSINGLDSNLIYEGQQLKVPTQQQGDYIVKEGDTLFEIAQQYNMTVKQLKLANDLTDDIINIGQELYIPDQETIILVNQLPDRVYSIGDNREDIKQIQKGLNTLGYSLVEDGVYGEVTSRTILDFQSQYGDLINDGVYGPKTKDYLQQSILTDHITVSNPSSDTVLVNKNNSLPSDYIPEDLVVPDVPFPFEEFHQKKLMKEDAARALEELFMAAEQEDLDLYAISGYRSYDRQESIFTAKAMRYGLQSANQFSAKPGESEHQTGLAMDVTSPKVGFHLTQSFGETEEGQWLKENAPKFGFVIRYPEGKEDITGYGYEPWHIRYIGGNLATEVAQNETTLEEYFGRA